MFANEERTERPDIDPAAVRLKGYQRRMFSLDKGPKNSLLNEKIDNV